MEETQKRLSNEVGKWMSTVLSLHMDTEHFKM